MVQKAAFLSVVVGVHCTLKYTGDSRESRD